MGGHGNMHNGCWLLWGPQLKRRSTVDEVYIDDQTATKKRRWRRGSMVARGVNVVGGSSNVVVVVVVDVAGAWINAWVNVVYIYI